jgi:hypothetical protein
VTDTTDAFRVLVVQTDEHITRVLLSERVRRDIPIIDELLDRLVASAFLEFPDSFIVIAWDEPRPESQFPIVVLPPWVFERMAEKWSKPRGWFEWILGSRAIDRAAYDIAYLLAHQFQPDPDQYTDVTGLTPEHVAYFGYFEVFSNSIKRGSPSVRALRTGARSARFMAPLLIVLPAGIGFVYLHALVRPKSHKALFRLAKLQENLGRRIALNRTKQRLLDAGAPIEKVRTLGIPPDLTMIERKDEPDA